MKILLTLITILTVTVLSLGQRPNMPYPMSEEDFKHSLAHIKEEAFDDKKMIIAKRMIDANYLYSHQVRDLVKEFSFKQNQEYMAKYAYPKTYDQKKYYVVNEAFTFSFSEDELNRWLQSQPINDYASLAGDHHHGDGNYNHQHHDDYGLYHNTNGGIIDNPNLGGNNNVNIRPNGDNNLHCLCEFYLYR